MSKIEWTEETLNPVVGCTRISPGCANCYAMTLHDKRHRAWRNGTMPNAPKQYHQPFEGGVQLYLERLDKIFKRKKPTMYFVNSVSDLFHEDVPYAALAEIWAAMVVAERHTFQVLTKRPARMKEFVTGWIDHMRAHTKRPVENIWLGVSVENQHWADERIPLLLQTPAAVRFLSCEPLLGPVDLPHVSRVCVCGDYERHHSDDGRCFVCARSFAPFDRTEFKRQHFGGCPPFIELSPSLISWVIVGGESGSDHRPFEWDWARSIRDQCASAGVALFIKQGGGFRPGNALEELPEDLRIREYPKQEA